MAPLEPKRILSLAPRFNPYICLMHVVMVSAKQIVDA